MLHFLFRITCGCLILLSISSCGTPPATQTKQNKIRAKRPRVAAIQTPALETNDDSRPESGSSVRPDDRRPSHDDNALEQTGIHAYESKHLKLYTDIDPEFAEKLPPLVDQLYAALSDYFGPLPPDRQQTDFQMTGYLMRDETSFREAGLLENVPLIIHGRHIANRFWMRSQDTEYFTRHLLLHECTHCFMTFVPGYRAPLWYSEGMAELFATHRNRPDGKTAFRILPGSDNEVPGWSRIPSIRRDIAAGKALTLSGVEQLSDPDYLHPQAYAWAWALCNFLDSHPRFQASFRNLSQHLRDGQFVDRCRDLFTAPHITTDWQLFVQHLQYGYNLTQAMPDLPAQNDPPVSQPHTVTLLANRGWQDSGVTVEAGTPYEITATGQFTLADQPKPWISEPQGITIEYFDGQPLGKLMACIEPAAEDTGSRFVPWKSIPIGKQQVFTAPSTGRLFLRLNDAWNSLDDNTGTVEAHLRRAD